MSGEHEAPRRAEDVGEAVEKLAGMERHVSLSSGDTRYFETGTGDPVLLLHGVGFTAGGSNWLFNMEDLGSAHRVIAPDFLGFGTGGRLEQPYSFAYLVDFVREFQDALGLDASDVVGHSMGGWVAALLAYESPGRVRRLVLIAAGGLSSRVPAMMRWSEMPARDTFAAGVAERLGLPVDAVGALADLEWQSAVVPGAVDAYGRLLAHMGDPETRRRYHLRRRLPRIGAETLVLWGEHDQVNEVSLAREMVHLVPRARLELFGCGHAVPTTAPRETNRALCRFLDRPGAGRGAGAS
ncbi:MAG TPA: alpha/beta fold hydrolase [Acidimicrobiales bacterium]|nr:alpha/beta fold hydrolase [Acidimicrobiales bacterium]